MKIQLILFVLIASSAFALDCSVTLPRLLLGERYYNSSSTETALVLFDTLDYCDQATLIPMGGSPFSFRLKQIVLQYVDDTLDHSGKSVEFVHYKRYTNIFSLDIQPGVKYTLGFMGHTHEPDSSYAEYYSFVLPRFQGSSSVSPLKILFFGDQDLTTRGANTLNYMNSHLDQNKFDAFIFLGDYAYEFYQNNGQKGDLYLEQFTPLSWSYPLVMTPGNHEDNLNFTLFNEKFRMPTYSTNNLNNFNSFNMGLIHFIHVNLDFYSLTDAYNQNRMLTWIESDLSSVNRSVTPWVIAVGHKLMYCFDPTSSNNKECIAFWDSFSAVDALFAKYNLDLFVTGHEHYNQIMAPMSNKTIHSYTLTNSTDKDGSVLSELTFNDGGYVSIIQGNGGCWSSLNNTGRLLQESKSDPSYNAVLQSANLFVNVYNVGFGWIEIIDSTTLNYLSYDAENEVYLAKYIISTNHGIVPPPENKEAKYTSQIQCLLAKESPDACLKYKISKTEE